jgi:inorganic pyrophosphatase
MTPTAEDLPDTVEVVVEVPRGAHIKRAADGSVDFLSPVACPFNYGSVPARPSADGEPLDAVVLGPTLPAGHRERWAVHGVVRFVDEGLRDDKLVCGAAPPDARDLQRLHRFFTRYARLKGAWARVRGRGEVRFEGWEPRP